jgi:peptidoglycan/xylan/chitin deacetylase (PgdA/CDA1 family)
LRTLSIPYRLTHKNGSASTGGETYAAVSADDRRQRTVLIALLDNTALRLDYQPVGCLYYKLSTSATWTSLNIMKMRAIGKLLAHHTGAMRAYHFRRNAATLTVLMFHRVLPEDELARVGADPLYTVTPRFLSDCVAFLRRHYTIVGLKEVLDAQARIKPLPRRAVLITFDDGWYDNLAHALPALAGTPWTLFAAANPLLAPDCWWQETLLWAMRSGIANFREVWHAADGAATMSDETSGIYSLLLRYAGLSPDKRAVALAPYDEKLRRELCGRPMMLAPRDLETLRNAGVDIGIHGDSHLPLSLLERVDVDLLRARALLIEWLGPYVAPALSFPHGQYDDRVLGAARASQYRLLFCSDAVLNRCENGWVNGDLLGRIPINMRHLIGESGRLAPHKLATWLFLRDIRTPIGKFYTSCATSS